MRASYAFILVCGVCVAACDATSPSAVIVQPGGLFPMTVSDQVRATGAQLSLSVRVTDGRSAHVSGATVLWEVTAGGGTVAPMSVQSSSSGVATTQLTVSAGENRVTARLQGTANALTFVAHGCSGCGEWIAEQTIEGGRAWAGTTVLGREVWLLGGEFWPDATASMFAFDPATKVFRQSGVSVPGPLSTAVAVTYNGRIYLIGGLSGYLYYDVAGHRTVMAYDAATGSWTDKEPMTYGRFFATGAVLNDKIHVLGGYDYCYYWGWCSVGPNSNHEIYDPIANRWTRGQPMLFPRALAGAAALDGKLYVAGGVQGSEFWKGTDQKVMEMYDPATQQWTQKAPVPVGGPVQLSASEGKIYALQTAAFSGDLTRTFVYDPALDAWTRLPNLPVSLLGPSFVAVDDRLYVIGGYRDATDRPFHRQMSSTIYVLRR